MHDLINAHGWVMNEQNFLRLKDSCYQLSIIPTYTYWTRDENDMIIRSKVPSGINLNIAVFKIYVDKETNHAVHTMCMITDINSEDDFYDFVIGIQKQIKYEQAA